MKLRQQADSTTVLMDIFTGKSVSVWRFEKKVEIIGSYLDSTFAPDVDVSTGVSCDGISILSKRHTQHILWLLVFLETKTEGEVVLQ